MHDLNPEIRGLLSDQIDSAEIAALKSEAGRLTESVAEIASATVQVAKSQTRNVFSDVRERIAENPLLTLSIVAVVAFVLGATR